jgi:hypothetical protein
VWRLSAVARSIGAGSAEIVRDAFNIVFTKVFTGLNFDKDNIGRTWIGQAMGLIRKNTYRVPWFKDLITVVTGDQGRAAHDGPRFPSEAVTLKAQSFSGVHDNSLDLVVGRIGQHLVVTPWSIVSHISCSEYHAGMAKNRAIAALQAMLSNPG